MNLSVCIPAHMISVDVKAETEGTVIAPVFTGNTITGPVTIISNAAGHGTVTVTLLTETHSLLAVSVIMLSDREPCSY